MRCDADEQQTEKHTKNGRRMVEEKENSTVRRSLSI